jgi:hypothetical protein
MGFRGRLEGLGADRDLIARAIDSLCELDPELAEVDRKQWFGSELEGVSPPRYAAVGYGQRGFVVDAISGHVLWAGAIEREADLPRSIADLGR